MVAVVFSCPGRHEEVAGTPAAGVTGKNLATLLELLSSELSLLHFERNHITVANAWSGVEYEKKTGRRQATDAQVREASNIARLEAELAHVTELVIFCGDKAKLTSDFLQLQHKPRRLFVGHLGLLGLAAIKTDLNGQPIAPAFTRPLQRANTRKRLEVVAHDICVNFSKA